MPAAAVKRRGLTLFGFIRHKEFVGLKLNFKYKNINFIEYKRGF